jgi:hypothetical protein
MTNATFVPNENGSTGGVNIRYNRLIRKRLGINEQSSCTSQSTPSTFVKFMADNFRQIFEDASWLDAIFRRRRHSKFAGFDGTTLENGTAAGSEDGFHVGYYKDKKYARNWHHSIAS